MTSSPAKATQRLGAPSLITLMWTTIPLIKVFGFAILVTDLSWVRPHKFYASKLNSILLRCKRCMLIRNGREETRRGRKEIEERSFLPRGPCFFNCTNFLPDISNFLVASFVLSFQPHIFTQRWISHNKLDGLPFREKKDFTFCFHWKLRVRSFEFRVS